MKLAAIKEPIYTVEFPDGSTKDFKLWDVLDSIQKATQQSEGSITAARDALRGLLGYPELMTHQAFAIQADATEMMQALDDVKKLQRVASQN